MSSKWHPGRGSWQREEASSMVRSKGVAAGKWRADSLATLAEQAYATIRHQIMHGELEPQSIVSERLLAERLQLGKSPIRVAVQRLASEGFLTVEPRRGILVATRSIQDIIDLFEIRVVLERLVVRQIAGNLQPEQVDRLRANLEQHRTLAESGDSAAALSIDFDFHRLLCAFHANAYLAATLNRVLDSLFPELRLSHKRSPGRGQEAVRDHEAVAEALIRGDAVEAENLMAAHFRSCLQFVMFRGARGDGRLLGGLSA
jgi:DNA-binding GntR family transcriptional regulator